MPIRSHLSYSILFAGFLGAQFCLGGTEDLSIKQERHMEVSMRMIGHQVLLSLGDSTSRVLPVEKDGDQYRIRFSSEFGFDPDRLSATIDSVVSATRIANSYIVEVVSCDTNKVVHSYEVAAIKENDVPACKGRVQPVSCYYLVLTIMEPNSSALAGSGNLDQRGGFLGMDTRSALTLLILLVLGLAGVIAVLLKRKAATATEVHVVPIGEFQFNKRNMELSLGKKRIRLTSKEADLLQLLSASANDTVERGDILASVWGDQGDYVGRTLDVFISKLRKKLEADANVQIVNIRGVGYKLVLGA